MLSQELVKHIVLLSLFSLTTRHVVEELAGAGKEVARRWQGGTCLSPASPNHTEAERKLLLLLFAIAWHHLDNVVTQT